MRELQTGIWHWQTPHPEWNPGADGLDWPEQILERLRSLLELRVELVLPTHGSPADRAALERALAG